MQSKDSRKSEITTPQSDSALQKLQRSLRLLDKGSRARWWRRRGSSRRGFWYEDVSGTRVTDDEHLARIRSLAIPPGYKEVRVSPFAHSRLQAVGIDAAGRLQYKYHADFALRRARLKYRKIEEFGLLLPRLRQTTNEHIASPGLGRERVLAVILRLINETYFRLGTEGSVRQYKTFGITSLRNHHLSIRPGDQLVFQFVGKHRIKQRRVLVDSELASLLNEIKSLGGSRLFNYVDAEGRARPITPSDVNRYIKGAIGPKFSAKDFRTWGGTLQAAIALAEIGKAESHTQVKRNLVKAVRKVAERLGNTPSVCKSSYIHPVVFERYQQGVTLSDFRPRAQRIIRSHQDDHNEHYELEEIELLKLFGSAGTRANKD